MLNDNVPKVLMSTLPSFHLAKTSWETIDSFLERYAYTMYSPVFLGSDLAASVVWPEKDRLSLSGLSDCFMYILDCRSILSEEEGRF